MEIPLQTPVLAHGVVQREWDQTLRRLRESGPVTHAAEHVKAGLYAHLSMVCSTDEDVAAAERILMDNLLFALWTRTERACLPGPGTEVTFAGQWLFQWRRAVPWRCDKVGGMSRLAPGTPQHQWTYRFNIIDVEA